MYDYMRFQICNLAFDAIVMNFPQLFSLLDEISMTKIFNFEENCERFSIKFSTFDFSNNIIFFLKIQRDIFTSFQETYRMNNISICWEQMSNVPYMVIWIPFYQMLPTAYTG